MFFFFFEGRVGKWRLKLKFSMRMREQIEGPRRLKGKTFFRASVAIDRLHLAGPRPLPVTLIFTSILLCVPSLHTFLGLLDSAVPKKAAFLCE